MKQDVTGRNSRVGWARRAGAAVPARLDGRARAEPRAAAADGGPAPDQRRAVVDRRQLRVPGGRVAADHGRARRSRRAPAHAADRRRGVRRGVAARGVRAQRPGPDRRPSTARNRGSDADAGNARADPRHVRGSPTADHGVRDLDGKLRAWRRDRPDRRRHPAHPLLVGLGLPRRRSGDACAARAGSAAAARVAGPRGRARRPGRRGALAQRRPGRGVRVQARRPAGRRRAHGRARPARRLPPAPARRPVDRPGAAAPPHLLVAAGDQRAAASSSSTEPSF